MSPPSRRPAPGVDRRAADGVRARLPLAALAPAKINLGLFVGPVRDGRHELVSVMQSITLADELVLELAGAGAREDEVCAPGVPGEPSANLAAVALRELRAATGWRAPPLRLTITKRIPVAAGLGGGSADAAAALRLAAQAAGISHRLGLLRELAAGLGSDVPAQLRPARWLVSGSGERLQALPAGRPPLGVLVLPIEAMLSAAEVYARADELRPPRSSAELARRFEELRGEYSRGLPLAPGPLLANDLEAAARSLCPLIDDGLELVRRARADVAVVSGSGPTVLGLFEGRDARERARLAAAAVRASAPLARAAVEVGVSDALPRRLPADRDVKIGGSA